MENVLAFVVWFWFFLFPTGIMLFIGQLKVADAG